jgi:hypothetical protein
MIGCKLKKKSKINIRLFPLIARDIGRVQCYSIISLEDEKSFKLFVHSHSRQTAVKSEITRDLSCRLGAFMIKEPYFFPRSSGHVRRKGPKDRAHCILIQFIFHSQFASCQRRAHRKNYRPAAASVLPLAFYGSYRVTQRERKRLQIEALGDSHYPPATTVA